MVLMNRDFDALQIMGSALVLQTKGGTWMLRPGLQLAARESKASHLFCFV